MRGFYSAFCRLVAALCCTVPAFFQPSSSQVSQARPPVVMFMVPPARTDPAITDGDGDNFVMFRPDVSPAAPLLVYIGAALSHQREGIANFQLARAIKESPAYTLYSSAVDKGYRVISLDYRYEPSGNLVCPHSDDPSCYEHFRQKKVFGTGNSPQISTTPASSIVNRLAVLLRYLARTKPDQGWQGYLEADGTPKWNRLTLSGLSQGAGMAAYLAKHEPVDRVILFSSPWDHYPRPQHLDGWLAQPGATPPDRWFGMYGEQEAEAPWLARAYAALKIPAAHIRVARLEPRHPPHVAGDLWHYSSIGSKVSPLNPDGSYAYQQDWDFMLTSAF